MKRIWFVSHYSMPPQYEMRVKTQMYAHYLGLMGYECVIFSASTIHNTDINLITDNSLFIERQYDDLKFVHIKTCNYRKSGLKRITNMLQFAYTFKIIANRFPKPDIIIADANCINYEPIYLFCRNNSIPMVLDVRDLWPLSIVEYLHYNPNNPIIRYLYQRENKMYQRMAAIIFSMGGYKEYLKDRKLYNIVNKSYYINNGVDLMSFNKNKNLYAIQDQDIVDKNTFKVVYTGSIRKVNNIDLLLDVAKKVENKRVKFLIWGNGEDLEKLKTRLFNEKIQNVIFKGYIEKKYIPYIVSNADLNLAHNKPSNLFRYGISFNKIFDYLAGGKPILSDFYSKYNPVIEENAGFEVKEASVCNIAKMIDYISILDANEYSAFCNNAFMASKKFDYRNLADSLLTILKCII